MTSTPTRAMVMAAGLGTRMRPLTNDKPKSMIEVGGKTLIDHTLDWLAASGVADAVVNTHYKAEMLEKHLAARRTPHITVSREDVLLETGGGITKALPLLGTAPFFSMNSDVICLDGKTLALARLTKAWDEAGIDALLLLHPVKQAVGYEGKGDFFLGEDGSLKRAQGAAAPYVFTGVQLLHPRLFKGAPEGPFSLNLLYNRGMQSDGTLNRVRGIAHDGSWLHIGDPQGLAQAEAWLRSH